MASDAHEDEVVVPDRAQRFAEELRALRPRDGDRRRHQLLQRGALGLMAASIAVIAAAFAASSATTNPLTQRDALIVAVGGLALAVIGSALHLRFALTGFLRFWLARQSYELQMHTDRLVRAPRPPVDPDHAPARDQETVS